LPSEVRPPKHQQGVGVMPLFSTQNLLECGGYRCRLCSLLPSNTEGRSAKLKLLISRNNRVPDGNEMSALGSAVRKYVAYIVDDTIEDSEEDSPWTSATDSASDSSSVSIRPHNKSKT